MSIVFSGGFQTYHLVDLRNPSWIQGTPCGFEFYYPGTNSLVSVHQREHRVCFSSGFRDITSEFMYLVALYNMSAIVFKSFLYMEKRNSPD